MVDSGSGSRESDTVWLLANRMVKISSSLFIILSYSDLIHRIYIYIYFVSKIRRILQESVIRGIGRVELKNPKRLRIGEVRAWRGYRSTKNQFDPLFFSFSSSLPPIRRRLICHDVLAQQFQLSAVGTMISVWRAAHNRFIKVAAARHSLAATGWQQSWCLR